MGRTSIGQLFATGAVGTIAGAALSSLLTAATLGAAGVYLGRTGAMDRASARFLSNLAMTVTVPSLYFSRLVESVSPELIVAAWPMLLMPALFVTVGLCLGLAVRWLTRPPPKFGAGIVAAVAFGNSTGLPLEMLSGLTLLLEDWWLHLKHLDHTRPPPTAADPVAFIALYGLTYPILQWGIGMALLRSSAPADARAYEPPKPKACGSTEGLSEPLLSDARTERGGVTHRLHTVLSAAISSAPATFIRRRVLLPPTCGVLLGVAVVSTPSALRLLCGGDGDGRPEAGCPAPDAPLGWLMRGIAALGDAAVPVQLIILGNAISRGPTLAALPMRCNVRAAPSLRAFRRLNMHARKHT